MQLAWSFRLDVGRAVHLAQLLGFVGDELGPVERRQPFWRQTKFALLCADEQSILRDLAPHLAWLTRSRLDYGELFGWPCVYGPQNLTDPRLAPWLPTRMAFARHFCRRRALGGHGA